MEVDVICLQRKRGLKLRYFKGQISGSKTDGGLIKTHTLAKEGILVQIQVSMAKSEARNPYFCV